VGIKDLQTLASTAVSRRATRQSVSADSLHAVVDGLLALNPDRGTQSKLKKYRKLVERRCANLHAYPQLLSEASDLMAATLDDILDYKPGWLAKKLGVPAQVKSQEDHAVETSADESTAEQPAQEESSAEQALDEPIDAEFQIVPDNPLEAELPPEVKTSQSQKSAHLSDPPIGRAAHLIVGDELKFTTIGEKVTGILAKLLDEAEVEECVQQKFIDAQARIDQGLNWYEFVATLEDVRDIVLQAFSAANDRLINYLTDIDSALLALKQQWSSLLKLETGMLTDQTQLRENLEAAHSGLADSLEHSSDADQLRQQVGRHIADLSLTVTLAQNLESQNQQAQATIEGMESEVNALQEKYRALEEELKKTQKLALTDALTELPNREAYNRKIHEEFKRSQRNGSKLSLAVVDVDHFKAFNDTYGHQVGDRVLKIIAKVLKQNLRQSDFVARFGGEEFVVVLPETSEEDAVTVLDKVREKLASTKFKFKEDPVRLTASTGISEFRAEDTAELAFARADEALYQAKEAGRNCVKKAN
jgi:diguanylate cyclase